MVGLGEREDEVREVLGDLRGARVSLVTIGQYLRPSREHLPVTEFVSPETFRAYADTARALGFSAVASAPFVRSSYHAAAMAADAQHPAADPASSRE
jgi:lipoic acid synthetase